MSFGFSVGDFVTTAVLVKNIITALQEPSVTKYEEIKLELHGLQQALNAVEHLDCPDDLRPSLNSIKVAALSCQHVLSQFKERLQVFSVLSAKSKLRDKQSAKLWGKKASVGLLHEG